MSCIDYFYKLLSYRDYTAYELNQKAREKGFELSEITEAIQDVQDKGYQSDIRFVEGMIASNRGKYGKSMIKRKCREKGIVADLFDQVWESQGEEEEVGELDDLKAKVMRKYKIDDFFSIEPKTKAKLWNYLQYRGFNPSEILAQWQREQAEEVE